MKPQGMFKKAYEDFLKPVKASGILNIFGVYAGTRLVSNALPFLVLPIMTRFLTPAEYGFLTVYQTLIAFARPFIGMSMPNNINRIFFRATREEVAKMVFNLVVVLMMSASLTAIGLFTVLFFVDSINGVPRKWLYTIPLIIFMSMVNQFNLMLLRNQKSAAAYGALDIAQSVLGLSLSLCLVVVFRRGWQGAALASVINSVLFGAIAFTWMVRSGFFKVDFCLKTIREILKLSLPLISHGLGYTIIFVSDNLFIDRMAGKRAVGIYAVGYFFGLIVYFVTDAFNNAWAPWMYKSLVGITEGKKQKIVKKKKYFNVKIL